MSHTRAVLVERAVVASWKLRRATRAEQARLYETGADAAHEFDLSLKERVEVGAHMLTYEPGSALARLKFEGAGIDRLIALWEGLADAAVEPRLDVAEGPPRPPARPAGPQGRVGAAGPGDRAGPRWRCWAPHDPAAAAALPRLLRRADRGASGGAVGLLGPGGAPPPRDRPGAAPRRTRRRSCCIATSVEHEKSLNAAIRGLLALEKSGADLPEPPEAEPEAVAEAGRAVAARPGRAPKNRSQLLNSSRLAANWLRSARRPRRGPSAVRGGRRGRRAVPDARSGPIRGRERPRNGAEIHGSG